MAVDKAFSANTDNLMDAHEKLKNEAMEKTALNLPVKSGTGHMTDKLDEIVHNISELHAKALELVSATSDMLKKIGIEFEEMDSTAADTYKKIN